MVEVDGQELVIDYWNYFGNNQFLFGNNCQMSPFDLPEVCCEGCALNHDFCSHKLSCLCGEIWTPTNAKVGVAIPGRKL